MDDADLDPPVLGGVRIGPGSSAAGGPHMARPDDQVGGVFGPRSVRTEGERRAVSPRSFGFIILLVTAFAGLAATLFSLQVAQGKYFATLADHNRIRQELVPAPRGILYDRHGTQLVTNAAVIAVAVTPADLPADRTGRNRVRRLLQEAIGVSPADFERQVQAHLQEPLQPFTLKSGIGVTLYQAISENLPSMPGVTLITDLKRHYVTDSDLSHILGYVGDVSAAEYQRLKSVGYSLSDIIGKTGLEAQDEQWLRGKPGRAVIETDAQGRLVRQLSSSDPTPGANVFTTIDLSLQKEVAKDLQQSVNDSHAHLGGRQGIGGAAIVMNPQTGEIYSMVSLPGYALNQFADGISTAAYAALVNDSNSPLLNRAIDGLYPPGSTFKPVVASAALQQGVVTAATQIFDPGFFTGGGRTFYGWFRPGFGNQNMVQAIAHSDDIYFYTVADRLGDLTLSRYARDFGVGRKSGIDLGPEANGIAPDRTWKKAYFDQAFQQTGDPGWKDSTWYEGDTITYGIGQSYLLVSPLQDLLWTATVANGGSYLRPQLTGRVTGSDGSLIRPFAPILDHRVQVSPQVLAVVRDGMRAAVASPGGTAAMLRNLPAAAGKTGTAQYGVPDATGQTPAHAWFTAFGPETNPEVAVVVFIEGGGEGSTYSEPVASRILDYYFAHRDQIVAH